MKELPKVPSGIFDLELEDGGSAGRHLSEDIDGSMVEQEFRRFLSPSSEAMVQVIHDVGKCIEFVGAAQATGEREVDIPALADGLMRLGHGVTVRHAIGGGKGFECLQNLRHSYLHVTAWGIPTQPFVVDPQFCEQFLIAKPTYRYMRLLAHVPEVLVFPECGIRPLVQFLCMELAAAFKSTNTIVPPWRQASSMLSKWLPRNLKVDEPAHADPKGQLQPVVAAMPPPVVVDLPVNSASARDCKTAHCASGLQLNRTSSSSRNAKPLNLEPMRIYGGFSSVCTSGPFVNLTS